VSVSKNSDPDDGLRKLQYNNNNNNNNNLLQLGCYPVAVII